MDPSDNARQLSYEDGRQVGGGDPEDLKEVKVLNRILRWTPEGITYEADPRHVEMLIKDFPPTGGSVKTAGIKVVESESDEPLQGFEAEEEQLELTTSLETDQRFRMLRRSFVDECTRHALEI